MGMYKYIRKAFQTKTEDRLQWQRETQWRTEPAMLRVAKPTNLASARSIGYKAKKGYIVIRARVARGGKQRPQFKAGRRSKHYRRRLVMGKNYQWLAEERVAKKFVNLEVLNSYQCGKDGKHYWFEIICVDPEAPEIKKDPKMKWVTKPANTRRVFRGLTSAAKRSRGLRHKGIGAEKIRPSLSAKGGKGK